MRRHRPHRTRLSRCHRESRCRADRAPWTTLHRNRQGRRRRRLPRRHLESAPHGRAARSVQRASPPSIARPLHRGRPAARSVSVRGYPGEGPAETGRDCHLRQCAGSALARRGSRRPRNSKPRLRGRHRPTPGQCRSDCRNSIVRACTASAREVVPGSAARSTMRTRIPSLVSHSASHRPVGPAPTMRTGAGSLH